MQALLNRRQVEARCGISRTSVYRLMRLGVFPTPLRVGVRGVRWPQREIEDWLAARPRATGDGAASKRGT